MWRGQKDARFMIPWGCASKERKGVTMTNEDIYAVCWLSLCCVKLSMYNKSLDGGGEVS